ncbi:MAG: hypothetical protein OP8BY_1231 [Candidatus Saccharicenans subterraneus]|uniref:Uncharacterized protein n=1 Tax=Candidatus Saccharicenans subterraneus TaxID=2508984 RepID=A0A3E2BPH3_9BACT|nr:MAG: hypothetical protein OP8BY_1231 [Candidatus Saccharicenans subterraneum]
MPARARPEIRKMSVDVKINDDKNPLWILVLGVIHASLYCHFQRRAFPVARKLNKFMFSGQ